VSYLLDTNVLLRSIEAGSPQQEAARQALERLAQGEEMLYIAPQNLIEFWAVVTRPLAANGLGLTPAQALGEITRFEAAFTLTLDSNAVFEEWKRLVEIHNVIGLPCHDARLVAIMRAQGIQNVLTFNAGDFRRYAASEGITIVDPANVSEPAQNEGSA
jgi:predicted nucleic acid-binding protein